MWRAAVRTSREGQFLHRITPATFDWDTSIRGDGTATLTFNVNDPDHGLPEGQDPEDVFFPNRSAVDLRWGTHVAFFGKVDHWVYDVDTGKITVKAVELAHEWSWRMTYGVGNYEQGTLEVNDRTHSGAAAAILERFTQWGEGWRYPIDLPADAPGSFSAKWEYWRKYRISDLIEQIREQGFEVYLRPYVAANGSTRLQSRVARRVTLGTSSFHLEADDRPIKKITYARDGSRQLTGVQGLGNGTGRDQHVAHAGFIAGSDIPYRDAKLDFPDLKGQALQDAAMAALEDRRDPFTQWSVGEFIASDQWEPAHATPGRVWQIETRRNSVIPAGVHTLRVIRARGGLGPKIQTEVQHA